MLLISSENLLMIFIALEILSVPLYVLTAFDKTREASAEAALKYFLFGSVAAAFTLFGISLLYGMTGELGLGAIAAKLRTQPVEPVCYAALVMTLIGFAFKVAAAPFHFWAPDVYEGAPAPIACFVASASKVASFFVLAKIVIDGFGPIRGGAAWNDFRAGWMPVLAVLAVLSMAGGNIAALAQTSVKRLLAYSAIAHGGYALLAFFGNARQMLPALLFYVITYALTVLGALAVAGAVENSANGDRMAAWAGLGRRAPLLAVCMFIFMLSLAGIPPLAGFFGKFYSFSAAVGGGAIWLAIIGLLNSGLAAAYYLRLGLVAAQQPDAQKPVVPVPRVGVAVGAALLLAVAATLVLGIVPGDVLHAAERAAYTLQAPSTETSAPTNAVDLKMVMP